MAGVANSSKTQYPGRVQMPETLEIVGSFQTNGASPVKITGKGYVVTQQGTGLYRIAFNINTPRIVAVTAMLVKAAPSATFLELQDMTATNNYVTFRVVNAAGTAVAPGAVGDLITFDVLVMTVKLSVL
jgi:hypothetical protein